MQETELEKEKRKDNDALTSYRRDKEALQKYRRTCILNLDIVESIARETNIDMLQLDSEKNIREWYANLKNMYRHYLSAKKKKSTLNDDDKIIQRVQSHYAAPDFAERFLPLEEQQFNDTIDILERRHLELLRRNQEGEQGEVYDVDKDTGEIRARAVRGNRDGEKEEGVFRLELSRFIEVAKRWETVPKKQQNNHNNG